MATLLGQDKTVKDIHASSDELKSVYEHLAHHYQDLGLVAPELGKEYTPEQLQLIREGKDFNTQSTEPDKSEEKVTPDETELKALVESLVSSVESKMSELETAVKIRLQVIVRMLEELSTDVATLKAQGVATPEESEQPEQDTRDICTQLLALKNLFDFNNATA